MADYEINKTLKLNLLILSVLISSNTFSQERKVIGRILDSETQKPIKNANIVILGTTSGSFSNQIGFFELAIDSSKHKSIIVSHIGYKTSEVLIPVEDRFKFFLEKEYIVLNELNLNSYPRKLAKELNTEKSTTKNHSDLIMIESGATFPNGMDNFYDFIGNSLSSQLKQVKERAFDVIFTINENGKATEISITDSTKSIEYAVINAFEIMPNWIPATQRQNNTSQYFILPIIKLAIPFYKSFSFAKIHEFISRNIKYPSQARKMGIEGVVYAEFHIDNSGNILSIKLNKDIGAGCGDEVRRIIGTIPTELTKSLLDITNFNKFILPVCFGLEENFKVQHFNSNSEALLLNEVAVTAIGIIRERH